jgi:hypothetical protein
MRTVVGHSAVAEAPRLSSCGRRNAGLLRSVFRLRGCARALSALPALPFMSSFVFAEFVLGI